jgi:hypothetical protein
LEELPETERRVTPGGLGANDCGITVATGAADATGIGVDGALGFEVSAEASFSAMTALANSVASAPQTGHFTGAAMRPLTGSVSNRNFAPQLQKTLTSIFNVSLWD